MPDEEDPAAVRGWAPSAAFRDAVRSVVLATLEQYVGIVEVLADEADREDGETMHCPRRPRTRAGAEPPSAPASIRAGLRGRVRIPSPTTRSPASRRPRSRRTWSAATPRTVAGRRGTAARSAAGPGRGRLSAGSRRVIGRDGLRFEPTAPCVASRRVPAALLRCSLGDRLAQAFEQALGGAPSARGADRSGRGGPCPGRGSACGGHALTTPGGRGGDKSDQRRALGWRGAALDEMPDIVGALAGEVLA